jgi:hypothetical protein
MVRLSVGRIGSALNRVTVVDARTVQMTIHPNAPPKPQIGDPEEYLTTLLNERQGLRKKDAERKVLKHFHWWNPWKPSWRPDWFTAKSDETQSKKRRQGNEDRCLDYQERWGRVHRQRHQRERQNREERERRYQERRSREGVGTESLEALFAKGDQVILEWSAKTSDYNGFRVEDHHTDADAVQIVLAALNQMKQERDNAIALISFLGSERKTLRSHIANLPRLETPTHRLYEKVGLHERCPDFVLRAARTAYRRALHPDGHPEQNRMEAERRFKQAEEVFEQIERLRTL